MATIRIPPELEPKLRARAEAEGISVEAYVERTLSADLDPAQEFEHLALEGIRSGKTVEGGPDYWAERHRKLDEALQDRARGR